MEAGRVRAACEGGMVLRIPFPHAFVPFVFLGAGYVLGEVHAFETGPLLRLGKQSVKIELTVTAVRDDGVRRAAVTNANGQRTRIDARKPDQIATIEPIFQMPRRAPV